jgi:hypothetical protein
VPSPRGRTREVPPVHPPIGHVSGVVRYDVSPVGQRCSALGGRRRPDLLGVGRRPAHGAVGRRTADWFAPPPAIPDAPPARSSLTVWAAAGQIRNADLEWRAFGNNDRVRGPFWVSCYGRGPADVLTDSQRVVGRPASRVPPAAWSRPLLRALEDLDRFAVAHYGLVEQFRGWEPSLPSSWADDDEPEGSAVALYAGLAVRLRWKYALEDSGGTCWTYETSAVADPAQLPAIRELWHRRPDVPARSAPYCALVAATAALPVAWLGLGVGRWSSRLRRVRRGHCAACGFDLRGSPGRCPECGTGRGDDRVPPRT